MTSNLLIQFLRPVLVTVSHCMLVKYITLNSIYNSLSSVSACFFEIVSRNCCQFDYRSVFEKTSSGIGALKRLWTFYQHSATKI